MKCVDSRAWLSKTFASGIESLFKFTKNEEVGGRVFSMKH